MDLIAWIDLKCEDLDTRRGHLAHHVCAPSTKVWMDKEKMNKWKECMETKGLKVNIGKTKVMASRKACGEVERTGKWPCAVCRNGVGVNSFQCTMCAEWVHQKCSGLRGSLTSVAATFKCKVCTEGAADGGDVELDLGDGVKLEGVHRGSCRWRKC
uniref:uncharacterized protein isoform X1 n=1 Tax=Myxine glutinosa TaxID=7769 RepID=UPI00358E6FB1